MDAIEATPHLLGCSVDGVSFTQVDFYDRSVLGEGIHCLKCGSFVNLPRDGDPMVQCPYCEYRGKKEMLTAMGCRFITSRVNTANTFKPMPLLQPLVCRKGTGEGSRWQRDQGRHG